MPQKSATLKATFSDVLAKLAFMFTEEAENAPLPGQTWLETTISYQGAVCGTLRFRCTREFAVLLAANSLGVDPGDYAASKQSEDAVKEFANIVCGQYVTAAHGAEQAYNLSIPQTAVMRKPPILANNDSGTTCTLCVDSHIVQLAHEQ